MAMTLEEALSESLRRECLKVVSKIGESNKKKIELRKFLDEGWEKRRQKILKSRIKDSQLCKKWKDRERKGLNEGTQRRSCYLGPVTL
jgi:hypothetical protein